VVVVVVVIVDILLYSLSYRELSFGTPTAALQVRESEQVENHWCIHVASSFNSHSISLFIYAQNNASESESFSLDRVCTFYLQTQFIPG
jgi:hypothetical protein